MSNPRKSARPLRLSSIQDQRHLGPHHLIHPPRPYKTATKTTRKTASIPYTPPGARQSLALATLGLRSRTTSVAFETISTAPAHPASSAQATLNRGRRAIPSSTNRPLRLLLRSAHPPKLPPATTHPALQFLAPPLHRSRRRRDPLQLLPHLLPASASGTDRLYRLCSMGASYFPFFFP